MANPKVLELATALLPKIRELIDSECEKLGASKEFGAQLAVAKGDKELQASGDAKAYYDASTTVFQAVIACAMQRMMVDGANRSKVSRRMGAQNGWELFLATHPEVAAKVTAEKAAKLAEYEKMQAEEGGEDEPEDNDENGH